MSLRKKLFGIPKNLEEFIEIAKQRKRKNIDLTINAKTYLGYNSGSYLNCYLGIARKLILKTKSEEGRSLKLKIKPGIREELFVDPDDKLNTYLNFFNALKEKADEYKEKLEKEGFEVRLQENNNILPSMAKLLNSGCTSFAGKKAQEYEKRILDLYEKSQKN